MTFRALGKDVRTFQGFDTFPAPAVELVTLTSDEVTAVCPVTGQPDWYTVTIEYVPDQLCLESKSLKLYFQSFRNEGIFGEALAARICQDVYEALAPRRIRVETVQKARGGITIRAVATREKERTE